MTEQMSVNDNNVSEHTLNVGQHFNDYEQLSKTVNVFCKEHYHPFVIRTRSQKQVLYKCCHGIKQNSKCLGKRPNQHYYYKNCKAQINFYKSKNEKWKLTKLLLNHNHTVGKEEYSNYDKAKIMNENDYETATDLILSSAKDGMVAAVLSKKKWETVYKKGYTKFSKQTFSFMYRSGPKSFNGILSGNRRKWWYIRYTKRCRRRSRIIICSLFGDGSKL